MYSNNGQTNKVPDKHQVKNTEGVQLSNGSNVFFLFCLISIEQQLSCPVFCSVFLYFNRNPVFIHQLIPCVCTLLLISVSCCL